MNWVVINVEDVILIAGLYSQVVKYPEKLGAMVCGVIGYVEQHLPHDEAFVFFGFFDRCVEQHVVLQLCQVSADTFLNAVPASANDVPIVNASGRTRG
jgi:hypothetical protein